MHDVLLLSLLAAAAQRAAKQAAAGRAVSRRGRAPKHPKLDMLRTASSLQQRISVLASSATGQRAAQGAIAAFHMPSRHLSPPKRKQGGTACMRKTSHLLFGQPTCVQLCR